MLMKPIYTIGVTPRISRFSFDPLGVSAGFLLTLLGNWERNENVSRGNVSPQRRGAHGLRNEIVEELILD
jgi:hypothetical protein